MNPTETGLLIGNNIMFRLECFRMSQKELCRRAGLPYNTVNNYVRGLCIPSAVNLKKMAMVFECTTDELLLGVLE